MKGTTGNFETVTRYMKIIQILDNHIVEATHLMTAIADGPEQIICFHLHSHLLYNPSQMTGTVDPYQDMVNPVNGITNGQVIIVGSPISGGMMSPQQIKDLIQQQQPPQSRRFNQSFYGHPPAPMPTTPELQSGTFKLDIGLTAAVLQVILDGYKTKKQEYLTKLAELGVNITFTDAEQTTATAHVSASS